MRRRGMTAISLVVTAAAVLALMLVVYYGIPGRKGGHEELLPGSEELDRQPGESIPQAAMNKARGVQCESNLRQIRLALQMAMQEEEGQPPASLAELPTRDITPEMLSCAVSGQPYSYDPSLRRVWCPTAGHENF